MSRVNQAKADWRLARPNHPESCARKRDLKISVSQGNCQRWNCSMTCSSDFLRWERPREPMFTNVISEKTLMTSPAYKKGTAMLVLKKWSNHTFLLFRVICTRRLFNQKTGCELAGGRLSLLVADKRCLDSEGPVALHSIWLSGRRSARLPRDNCRSPVSENS